MRRVLFLLTVIIFGAGLLVGSQLGADAGQPEGVGPDRYIVTLQPGTDPMGAAAAAGVVPDHAYQHALRGFSARLTASQLAKLEANPAVVAIEPDQVVSITAQTVPTGVRRSMAAANLAIDIDAADDYRVDADVAVIDTGVDLDHPDLNVFRATNCTSGSPFSATCGSGGDDDNGHGTHVGGTIGALDNNVGVVGVAPGARLWAVKVLDSRGSGYMSWIVAGIDYVTANAASIEVANMSLGCECTSSALNTAISNSVNAGVVFVVAAGNNDKDANTFAPANHSDVVTISALADFNGFAGGGAAPTCRVDQDDTLADFSNFGSAVEVVAPGVCILSTWPGGGYNTISGTSMASPHAAGAAALLASRANPSSRSDVLAIRATLVSSGNFGWTDDSGDGIQEPALDVSSATFAPVLVAGSGTTPTATPTSTPTSTPTTTATPTPTSTPTSTPTATPTSPSGFTLSAVGYKVRGLQRADLTWSATSATQVDVYRNGTKVATTANDRSYTDPINSKGSGTYRYRVCNAGTTTCSNEAIVSFN